MTLKLSSIQNSLSCHNFSTLLDTWAFLTFALVRISRWAIWLEKTEACLLTYLGSKSLFPVDIRSSQWNQIPRTSCLHYRCHSRGNHPIGSKGIMTMEQNCRLNRIVSTLQSQRYILAHLGVQRRTKLFRLRNAVEPTTDPRSRIFIDSVICQSIYSHCFDCRFRYLCTIRNLSCEVLKDCL